MAVGVFKGVREVSSEDPAHPATNLLKLQAGKTWKTKSNGEKEAYVIFEFDVPQTITGIDIGNEHSAFVGVLVSKSGCSKDDFQEILMMSSLMTPIESKNSTNFNRIRCFNKEALVETVAENKCRMVKVVCIQPFNKHVQYGLAFVKVHVKQGESNVKEKSLVPERFLENIVAKPKPMLLGNIKLRKESSDSDTESSGSLFARWKMSRNSNNNTTLSPSLQLRDSTFRTLTGTDLNMSYNATKDSNDIKVLDRNRDNLLFGNEGDADDIGKEKEKRLSKHIEKDKERLRMETEKLKAAKEKEKLKAKKEKEKQPSITNSSNDATIATTSADRSGSEKRTTLKRLSSPNKKSSIEPPKKKKMPVVSVQYRPFHQLLRGVVLVISGIQNPERSDLRSKALALGAKYKTDWDSSCTHLICAFKNTPKYNQVKGKGKIVTASWIKKCYDLKKYLPWRRYALDGMDLSQPESDEELLDEALKPNQIDESDNDVDMMAVHNEDNEKCEVKDGANNKLGLVDFEKINACEPQASSGSDTEDELERVAQKHKLLNQNNTKKCETSNVFEVDTDEEDFLTEKQEKEKQFLKNNSTSKRVSVT